MIKTTPIKTNPMKRTSPPAGGRRFELSEALEPRKMFSVAEGEGAGVPEEDLAALTIPPAQGVSVKNGVIAVGGSAANDIITVSANKAANQFTITINGIAQNISATGVKSVKVLAAAGNDTVNITSANADSASLYKRVIVEGGDGNDTLTTSVAASLSGGAGNDTLNGSTRNDQLSGGAGDDVLRSNGGRDSLSAGIGNNVVRYANGIDFDSSGTSVRLDKSGLLTIRGNRGNDTLELATNVGNNLRVTLAGQQSDIALGTVKGIRVVMGSGNDEVRLGNYNPARLTLTKPASIDGGTGTDTLRGRPVSNQILTGRFEATPAT